MCDTPGVLRELQECGPKAPPKGCMGAQGALGALLPLHVCTSLQQERALAPARKSQTRRCAEDRHEND